MAGFNFSLLTLAVAAATLSMNANASGVSDITPIGRYAHGVEVTLKSGKIDDIAGKAEIVAYDKTTKRLFVVNAVDGAIDVLNITDPTNPISVGSIDVKNTITGFYNGSPNSVAAYNGLIAVAVQAETKQDPGVIAFYDAADLSFKKSVNAGALPDMVTFTPDGKKVISANEGEPNSDYTNDPEGSVSIIDLSTGLDNATVTNVGFGAFDKATLVAKGVRIFGLNATAAQDIEPEYITVSQDSKTAWATLQENNAIAEIDLVSATVKGIYPLGTKDHSLAANTLDASDKDSTTTLKEWPVKGFYLPDAISNLYVNGKTYVLTANEGDSRDYSGYSEEKRVKDLTLDATAFPTGATLKQDANLGRLKTTTANGDTDGDGDFDVIHAFGARSFSVWDTSTLTDTNNTPTFDSGNQFATKILEDSTFSGLFNADGLTNSPDARSDDKGVEPEAVTVGKVGSKHYAFVGLERIGGVMIYDVTTPTTPTFVKYVNNRNTNAAFADDDDNLLVPPLSVGTVPVTETLASSDVGDISPEGMTFIAAEDSPNNTPLLVVAHELSGTTTIFQIKSSEVDAGGITAKTSAGNVENMKVESASAYPTGKPDNMAFDYGVTSYKVTGLTNGQTITMTLTMPSAIPANSKLYKITSAGYTEISGASIDGNTVSFSITDGGTLDADKTANGTIVDPVAIGTAVATNNGGGGSFHLFGLLALLLLPLVRRLK
ncbi:choice-of-anchor I family protein [Candidatus Thiothrix anitrata]|uniref:Choice-of-anchor I family protein n=1 Tax=Candidatus Thiothrix anitrata TaxID=2823902 RepID=A0ABX7WY46_9GAMM|nr:choice-of-anchor I family protein [Candidatus Thiothrix anitrata]QTR48686.1 choice-of-anchor I family protein [Candidatus Thiothrix anitrata]